MNFWKWIWAYWKGYTVLVATPEKHYRLSFLRGNIKMTTETPEPRGERFDMVWLDEATK